ncbi:MAG: DUF3320 domain-containing protein [Acutalibacteraceae bacterium]|nr:DUF3320 domain-containing protein [Acutalibacteraceae bacterium]
MDKTQNNIVIEANTVPVINYALQQNKIPAVQSIVIHNNTDADLSKAELSICSDTEVILPFSTVIEFIPAHKSFQLKDVNITINANFLAGITEKIKGILTFTLKKDGEEIATENVDITALAFDEWHGSGYYPELLSAFVTPNHPAIVKIIGRAAEFLKEWTGDPSMDAYFSKDANRVLNQAAAIFSAIKEENLIYCVPPASFEKAGQRVRLCDAVLKQKMGTCLDLTLLYVSCLEAIGLHPLMILQTGHIFSGVWLDELSFPEAVQDDPSLITKRLANGVNEIAVIETTLAVNGKNASFDDARQSAEHSLVGTEPIECIIDVFRTRLSGIAPLPQRVHGEDGWTVEHDSFEKEENNIAPKAIDGIVDINSGLSPQNNKKLIQWERKLLDLGLRNNLINLRYSKTIVPILTSGLDDLEDALSSGSEFTVLPRPADWKSEGEEGFETNHDLGEYINVIKSEFANKRLRSVYTDAELSRIIKGLYRTAKSSLEENGANTLYLSLGILRWYESQRSKKPRYAPLVLLPVEIIRKAANKGFTLRVRDDEPQINITILEKIKQDFGLSVTGLEPLPFDEKGVDLRKVFTLIRKAVMEQPRWDVLESAYLGIFSFSQFVMWNDLHNRAEDLLNNKIVKSLVEGKLCFDALPMEIGEKVDEDSVLLPMSADASQLYAIEAACSGQSFVLHGPPGTGKSQTITSLIANALAQGKSVLFVAEKMAALQVVQKRLENIGIGPFCLELHSNKSKKRDVLEQLRKVTEVTKYQTAEEYEAKAEKISAMRKELDGYASLLHSLQPCGYSLYELINEYEEYRNASELELFSSDYTCSLGKGDMHEHIVLLERLVAAAKATGEIHNHPLSPVALSVYSQQLRKIMPQYVSAYKEALCEVKDAFAVLSELCKIKAESSFALEKLYEASKELTLWLSLPDSWKNSESINSLLSGIKELSNQKLITESLKKAILENWNEDFLSLDSKALLSEYNAIASKWFIPKLTGMNQLCKRLSVYSKTKLDANKLGYALSKLYEYHTKTASFDEKFKEYGDSLGTLYLGAATDWQSISDLVVSAEESRARLIEILGEDSVRTKIDSIDGLKDNIDCLAQKYLSFAEAKENCYKLLCISETSEENWCEKQVQLCDDILANADCLKEWIAFNGVAKEVEEAGLFAIASAYKTSLSHEEVIPVYKKAVLYRLITEAIDKNPSLNSFSGAVFNEKIEQFRRIDKELIELSRKEIYCRLASKVPNFVAAAAQSSELGILQKNIKSGGRGTSIRKLFEDIANLLPRLCPCMLMSPISAAQYLDPKHEAFDIVVFDEASQLPTCKAVGVLARGKDAVIVGDPNQMPPTAFFATNTVDEDNLDIEDLESILDDCLALNMPQTHLLWHYRSRHESLIAFSNSQFYENKLFTFPSVNDRQSKVSLVHIDGVFERSKSRTNKAEAQAVVNEIIRRSKDSELSKQSVGVVTFNIAQQHLIDDLLAESCEKDESLEKWIYEAEEPLFIKNLENVQGDERDVILFSIGYGPDATGKVYMNFGPLNREGGWRRLNVAVSRARNEMMVFSTLTPEQINLSATSAKGVAALKAFLEYAASNRLTLDSNSTAAFRHDNDGIAKAICAALKENGYDTDLSVGNSKYRIDIGIINPDNKDKYILGILLDGSGYGSSKTTRDREIAQVNVLSSLGWDIMRIWTMDWWDNREKEIARILAKIADIKDSEAKEEAQEPIPQDTVTNEPVVDSAKTQQTEKPCEEEATKDKQEIVIPYTAYITENPAISGDDFVSGSFDTQIIHTVLSVINCEAPISHALLTKRVINSFGILRAGNRIHSYIDNIVSKVQPLLTEEDGQRFYYTEQTDLSLIRVSGEKENKREIKDVPLCEAVNAVCYILENQVSLKQDDLINEAARLMGYTRSSQEATALFSQAIVKAENDATIKKGANESWIIA